MNNDKWWSDPNMRIKWYGHASFLIQTSGVRIITDPYTPSIVPFEPIREPADIVIRSSDDDKGHNNAQMIPGNATVVTATEIIDDGLTLKEIRFDAVAVREHNEHPTHKTPLDNAMYTIRSEELCVGHMGDVGHALTNEHIHALKDCDILLALTGGFPTIDLDDLDVAIEAIQPKVIIPMHYAVRHVDLGMLRIDAFTNRFPSDAVRSIDGNDIQITGENIDDLRRVIVLKPTC